MKIENFAFWPKELGCWGSIFKQVHCFYFPEACSWRTWSQATRKYWISGWMRRYILYSAFLQMKWCNNMSLNPWVGIKRVMYGKDHSEAGISGHTPQHEAGLIKAQKLKQGRVAYQQVVQPIRYLARYSVYVTSSESTHFCNSRSPSTRLQCCSWPLGAAEPAASHWVATYEEEKRTYKNSVFGVSWGECIHVCFDNIYPSHRELFLDNRAVNLKCPSGCSTDSRRARGFGVVAVAQR